MTISPAHRLTKGAQSHEFFFLFLCLGKCAIFAAVARTEPTLRLLEVTLDFYKLSQAGLAYVQILPLITPKNVFIQNICGGVQ